MFNLLCFYRGQDKTADFRWDKTPDFGDGTKSPILKWDKTADFVKEDKLASKLFLRWKRLGLIIDK